MTYEDVTTTDVAALAKLDELVHKREYGAARSHALPSHPALTTVGAALIAACDLSEFGTRPDGLPGLARSSFDVADHAWTQGEAELATLALSAGVRLLFHPDLHADGDSPLITDPDAYLAPLRASEMFTDLVSPSGPARTGRATGTRSGGRRTRVRVLVGAYPRFAASLVEAIGTLPGTRVDTLDLGELDRRLKWLGPNTRALGMRVAAHPRGAMASVAPPAKDLAGCFDDTDVVIADWADRGAMWASVTVPPHVRFVVRMHGMDALSPWVHFLDWRRVDDVVFVSAPFRALTTAILGDRLAGVRTHVLDHGVDPGRFDPQGQPLPDPSADRTLGMIGWGQSVKDPGWALDVLDCLLAEDPTWRLLLVGHPPNPQAGHREGAHAREILSRIDGLLREHVECVPFTEDVPVQTARMGFVLSASRRESFHLAVAEGALAGAVPVVRDWPVYTGLPGHPGPREIFPPDWVVATPAEAAARILEHRDPAVRAAAGRAAAVVVRQRFSPGLFAARVGVLLADGERAPLAEARLVLAELTNTASTAADIPGVAAEVFGAADRAWEAGNIKAAADHACLGLELLFHRELHSDTFASPLLEDPTGWLAPLRDSTVGRLLTTTPDAAPARAQPAASAPPPRLRVKVSPGPSGTFYVPVARAVQEHPEARVEVLDTRLPGFTTLGVDPVFVRMRLAHATGAALTPGRREPAVGALRTGIRNTDVLFADWADKAAVVASMISSPEVRLIVRVHSVDVLRPWLHLIDWSRVEAVVCVSGAIAALVSDLVGARLSSKIRVIGNVVEAGGFDVDRGEPRAPRMLSMVGWGKRVKDPLWAVEVLAELSRDGEPWRLMLVGAGFGSGSSASGRAYEAEFWARVAREDVRDRIVFVGHTNDLPRYLARADFIISASRRESFHIGAIEGVLAGAVPVIRDWPLFVQHESAATVYPREWVVGTVAGAAARIREHSTLPAWQSASARAREVAAGLGGHTDTAQALRGLVLGAAGELGNLIDNRQDEAALAALDGLLGSSSVADLRTAARAAQTLGEPSRRLAALTRIAELRPTESARRAARNQLGRLREIDVDWQPTVSNPTAPYEPIPGRVLHVLKVSEPDHGRGYSMRAYYTLKAQRERGIDAVGVTSLGFAPAGTPTSPGEPQDVGGVPHYRLTRAVVPAGEPLDEYLQGWADGLTREVARLRPEVIHAHSGFHGFDGVLLALAVGRAFNIPVIYEVRGFFETLWSRDLLRAEHGEIYRRRLQRETECMEEAAAVITLSESMRAEILSRGIDPAKVHVVPNAVDVATFEPCGRPADLVEKYGLSGQFVFGYVSNLDIAREGQEFLIHAALELRKRGIPATALIVGGGKRFKELTDLADELDAGESVIFTGQVPHEHVQDYYRLCDVFVVPRIREKVAELVTPLKPYEAMALGVPVVVSDLAALQEVIGEGDRGASFEAGNVSDLVEVLAAAYRDPTELEHKAARALTWVREERTWHANAEIYLRIYEGLDVKTERLHNDSSTA